MKFFELYKFFGANEYLTVVDSRELYSGIITNFDKMEIFFQPKQWDLFEHKTHC